MQQQDQELEKLVRAICWKLGFEPYSSELEEKWEEFTRLSLEIKERVRSAIHKALSSSVDLGKNAQQGRQVQKDYEPSLEALEEKITTGKETSSSEIKSSLEITATESTGGTVEPNVSAIAPQKPKQENPPTPPQQEDEANQEKERSLPTASKNPPIPTYQPPDVTSKSSQRQTSPSSPENQPPPIEETPTPAVAQWKYFPVPNDEPDKHDESYCKSGKSPEGLKLIGARVRGKMHKHNGTHCDDWFEFATSSNWTIIAVSDGAGSKKFSRVGAKVSCQAAVKYLQQQLKSIQIEKRETKEALSTALDRDANWEFVGTDINFVQNSLHQAMKVAYEAIREKVDNCSQLVPYYKALGNRELDIKDCSATLLLAVHTTVKAGENQYNLVITCQVGDGMLAAISQEGTLRLLGKPDSGEYAGQTEFLTSKNKIERENLIQKTFIFPGHLKALMVMTDGVADDYFPNNPGMLQLYGDLVLNQVIDIPEPSPSEMAEALGKSKLRTLSGVKEVKPKFQVTEQAIAADGTKEVKISYVDAYAQELGISWQNVVASPALLWVGASGEPMCDECKNKLPEEKLRVWLDSYYRRSSFDDRTLVVLYREEV